MVSNPSIGERIVNDRLRGTGWEVSLPVHKLIGDIDAAIAEARAEGAADRERLLFLIQHRRVPVKCTDGLWRLYGVGDSKTVGYESPNAVIDAARAAEREEKP